MAFEHLRGLIFDLDDTLFSEREYAFSGFAAVAREFEPILGDVESSLAQMTALYDSVHRGRVFDRLLSELTPKYSEGAEEGRPQKPDAAGREASSGDVGEVVRAMIACYRSHRPMIALHPDVERSLSAMRGRYKLGLISDGPAVMQRAKVETLGLASRFDVIVLTDEWGDHFAKPARAPFEHVATALVLPGHALAYVADNPAKDFVAPNAMGWTSIRIRREDGVYRDTPSAKGGEPAWTFGNLDEFMTRLEGAG